MTIPELSVVETLVAKADWAEGAEVPVGAVGTVISAFSGDPPSYDVEFVARTGDTWAIGTYSQAELRLRVSKATKGPASAPPQGARPVATARSTSSIS